MRVGLQLLTWNSERTISAVVKNLEKAVDEICVLDQFSQDGTIPFLISKGVKLFQMPWQNDMAARRNFLVKQSNSEYLISLDSDETIHPDAVRWMREHWESHPEEMIVFRNVQMKDGEWAYTMWFGHTTVRAGPIERFEWKNLNRGINEVLPGPGRMSPYPILNWGNSIMDWNQPRFVRTLTRWIEEGSDSVMRETGAKSPSDAFEKLKNWESVHIFHYYPVDRIPLIAPNGKVEP